MVCGCEKCGTLMVQEQKGIQCRVRVPQLRKPLRYLYRL